MDSEAVSVQDDTPPEFWNKVEDLWFDDGSIVVRAGCSIYRLSKSLLMMRSPVLRDLLSVPDTESSQTYEQCPVVTFPDAAREVTPFLKAIFDSSYFDGNTVPDGSFVALAGILRLSHKYDVQYLRRRALSLLARKYYPTQLAEWDTCAAPATVGEHYLMANIALETDAQWLLPAILVRCTQKSNVDTCFDGAPVEGVVYRLPPVHQRICITAMNHFLRHRYERVKRTILSDYATQHPCGDTRCATLRSTYAGAVLTAVSSIIDRLSDTWWEALANTEGTCQCTMRYKTLLEHWRALFWQRIPKLYNLPPWAELEVLKESDLGESSIESV
ncbi:hypothetical protein FISHEDRAFT_60581 [Fistulina hepatica ATCC 64428]|uniref:BTB domain-containing protein n=1 Tax=Fistulina hepatica ATCC 64428 TaxID=1128425 RepID=A0A0D7A5K4_9AGAR|nr:hypothetical protein FISHEDRAFT_60581 [Fistulina hepatica ATCC 64428]